MLKEKKTSVMIFAPHYKPAYKAGGVVRTLSNMIDQMSGYVDFSLVTGDRDLGDSFSYESVEVNKWQRIDSVPVYYFSGSLFRFLSFVKSVKKTDVIYLNGFFSFKYSIIPLLLTWLGINKARVVIAIRGESSDAALAQSAFKKKMFLGCVRLLGLYREVILHATSEQELKTYKANVDIQCKQMIVAQDLVAFNDSSLSENHVHLIPKVVFLGRILSVKNLNFALKVLKHTTHPVHFDIYGPVEDEGYWGDCQRLIEEMPDHICVNYCGVLDAGKVLSVLSGYDLLFLPSKGENFGHVIYEALSVGVPVLISDMTPWRDLSSVEAGFDVPLDDLQGFLSGLEHFLALKPSEREKYRVRSMEFSRRASSLKHIDDNLKLFEVSCDV